MPREAEGAGRGTHDRARPGRAQEVGQEDQLRRLGQGRQSARSAAEGDQGRSQAAERVPLLGKDLARVDVPLKVNGSAKYGIDTQLPDMLYASVLHPPVQGEKAATIDDSAARRSRASLTSPSRPASPSSAIPWRHEEGQGGAQGHVDRRRRRANTATPRSPPTTRKSPATSHAAVDMVKNGDAAGAIAGARRCSPPISSPITSPTAAWSL